ncbi:cytochrome P450 [Artemisia annua]|uniref:Cytochrome P450 n=1 Tax=Artemisia annua TaxID=35608 RepID=A0A2U1LJA0_ARTAN|nr:cytochrome P450 [Artemisia annua]
MAAYITFFAIFFIILFIYKHFRKRTNKVRLPYGDMGLPWIGETVEFYKAQRMNQLYEDFFQPRFKKYGNVFKTKLMGSPTVVVNGTAANKFFMSNEFKLVVSSWPTSSVELMGKNSIMEKQGDSHRCLRGIITSTVNISGLEAMVPRMCNSIQNHMEKNWQNQEEISLYRSTKMLTFTIVLECLFGIGIETEKMFGVFERVLEGVLSPPINFPGTKFSRAKKARSEIEMVLIGEVRRKREAMENGRDEEDGMLFSKLEFFQPRFKKYGNVFKTKVMGSPTVVVNGTAANKFFMSNEFKLVVSSWPTSSVELMGKNSIMEILTVAFVASLHRLSTILGLRLWSQECATQFRNTWRRTGKIVKRSVFIGTKVSRAKKARAEIEKVLNGEVRRKREELEGGKDEEDNMLFSKLVAAFIRGEITEEEVVDNVVLLVFAAHDTTSYAITMTFKMLANHPDCYSRLLKEHEEIASSKRSGEALTFDDVKKMEKATTDIQFEGITIPKDWKIQSRLPLYTIWYGGPRLCAGYQLAKLNILVLVHYVVTRYNWSLVYPDEPILMDPLPFPSKGMPIKISPKSDN